MVTSPLSTSMVIVWKGPDGTAVVSPIRPEMKSLTLYTSSSGQLTSVDSADSGEYTCTVRFENFGAEISASTNITIGNINISIYKTLLWHSNTDKIGKLKYMVKLESDIL